MTFKIYVSNVEIIPEERYICTILAGIPSGDSNKGLRVSVNLDSKEYQIIQRTNGLIFYQSIEWVLAFQEWKCVDISA